MDWSGILGAAGALLGPVGAIAGMIVPPVVDFAKKKWLPGDSDTPEATLSTLATTKPEVMVDYVDAMSKQIKAKVKYFNRDVVGEPAQWVVSLRAAIRPITTAICACVASAETVYNMVWGPNPAVSAAAAPAWVLVGNWFGTRLK